MVSTIKMLALDIDGVLTDGQFTLSASGEEVKRLDFHDLDALTAVKRSGMPVVFVTGENGPLVNAIAQRFGVEMVTTGAKDKLAAINQIAHDHRLDLSEICYVGDSDRDAPALRAVGLGLAPANATPAARAAAHRVLRRRGGSGAVAEAIELMERLSSNGIAETIAVFERIVQDSINAHHRLLDQSLPTLVQVAQAFIYVLQSGGKLLFFGNGGSAADAQHVAGELVGRFLRESEPWPAIALTTDTSILTAVGNDWTFDDVFARQIRALAKPGDAAIGISTSGRSPNVLRGLRAARDLGAFTIGFTGVNGGLMTEECDIVFCAPANETPRIQELHLLAWHSVCEIVENVMIDGNQPGF
ncbi:MAG: SIS domain-containing protein [Chloroflexi bacterium]|nr:MAG: SIS domain-containing protein [Chloroflexota bacterium]